MPRPIDDYAGREPLRAVRGSRGLFVAARLLVLVLVSACLGLSCSFNVSHKLSCDSGADCLSGYACIAHTCRALAASAGAASISASEAAGAPNLIGNLGGSAGAASSLETAGLAGSVGGAADGGSAGSVGGAAEGGWAGSVGGAADGGSAGDGQVEPTLSALSASLGYLLPGFDPQLHDYQLDLALLDSALRFSASAEPGSSITVNGVPLDESSSALVDLDASGSKVEVVVSRNGVSSAYSVDVRRSLDLTGSAFLKAPDVFGANSSYGMAVATIEDTLVVGRGNSVDIFGRNLSVASGKLWDWTAHLTPAISDTASSMDFGFVVALSADTLLVSAAEAAYVYAEKANNDWPQSGYLTGGTNPAGFGASMAVLGDLIAIGAPDDSSNATGINGDNTNTLAASSGAVYTFRRSGEHWIRDAYLKASNATSNARFGASVALSAHGLAVGSPGDGGGGAAYLFTESGGIWSQTSYLKASNADQGDNFGASVAFDGLTLVVGAPLEQGSVSGVSAMQADNALNAAGAVYVFQRPAGAWQEVGYLKAAKPAQGEQFGWSVALAGKTVAVGEFAYAAHDGSAYLFAPNAGVWSLRGRFTGSMARSSGFQHSGSDEFGRAIALSATRLIVGAPFEVESQDPFSGTVYSFE